MKVVVIILVVLFAALFVVIPIVEKYGRKYSQEELSKMSRYFLPVIGVMLVLQLLVYLFK